MARLVKVSLCPYCTEWAWSFRASLGMDSIDSLTQSKEDRVESGLGTFKLFAQFTVVDVRLLAGHQASYLCSI
eukprot:1141607-Pelagomonas_calceolata.AAC.4